MILKAGACIYGGEAKGGGLQRKLVATIFDGQIANWSGRKISVRVNPKNVTCLASSGIKCMRPIFKNKMLIYQ